MQFIGALFNDMIKGINNELSDAIGGVANIFPSGDIEGLLRDKAEGLLGIASVFDDCDIQTADLGGKTNKWILGAGHQSKSRKYCGKSFGDCKCCSRT